MSRLSKITLCLILPSLFMIVSCSNGEMTTLEKIRRNKHIIIGTDAVNLPFEFGKGTGVQGFDVDIAEEIAKDIGYDIRWIKIPFSHLFESLEKRDVNMVISSISITEERKKRLAFSLPYFESGHIIAIRREQETIKGLKDLKGLRIGVQEGTTGEIFLMNKSNLKDYKRKDYATIDDALLALNQRDIDAVIGDYPVISYSIFSSFPQLRTIGKKLTREEYAVVVRKEDTELLGMINKTLKRLKSSGRYQEIYKSWFEKMEKAIADEKQKEADMHRLQVTPKRLTFNWVKEPKFKFRMSRLDGFNIRLRNKETGRVTTSSAIETNGNRGSCSLRVVPGTYEFSMKGFNLVGVIEVPLVECMSMRSTINFGSRTIIGTPKCR